MSNSVLYAGSNVAQATTVSGVVISFDNIVRKYGNNIGLSGGNVVVKGQGYYNIDVNLTISGSATGTLLIQVYKDGVAVPYANAQVETTATSVNSVTIPCVVRECGCGCNCSTITVVASGVVASAINSAIVVEKE